MRHRLHRHLTPPAAIALLVAGCAGSSASGPAGSGANAAAPAPLEEPGARNANLAGTRCASGVPCQCRDRKGDPAEKTPPDADHKRFEIRLSAAGGGATLDSPTLGHFAAGADEACFYIDVLPGTTSEVTFTAREAGRASGISPVLEIAEYGPKGPWWYDILALRCAGPAGRCNRDAADAWGAEAKTRKRGRIDPCGSTVISRLLWDTSGGVGDRELGLFRDFTLTFSIEVKRFATQFKPGSTECVPK